MIKLLVGLGNPGTQYETTRHNAGFWWLDNLADQVNVPLIFESKYQSLLGKFYYQREAIWLLKPQSFMNLSGKAVAQLAHFYKILPEEILVAHDELDLPVGRARLKLGGSPAGHNGIKDIAEKLGTQKFWRLRLGIDRPLHREQVTSWVLQMPSDREMTTISDCILRTLKDLPDVLAGQFEQAMTKIHTEQPKRPHRPPSSPEKAKDEDKNSTL